LWFVVCGLWGGGRVEAEVVDPRGII